MDSQVPDAGVTEGAFRVNLSECASREHRVWCAEATSCEKPRLQVADLPKRDTGGRKQNFHSDRKKRNWQSVSVESNRRKRNARVVSAEPLISRPLEIHTVRADHTQREIADPRQPSQASCAVASRACGQEAGPKVAGISNDRENCVLSIVMNMLVEHNYHTLADVASLQRSCRTLYTGFNTPYLYLRILRDCYNVQFQIPPGVSPVMALRNWLSHHCEWLPLQDEGSIWLSRAVDPNPVGSHDRPVYVFGGQSVHESRYSNALFKISLNGHQMTKEEIAPEGMVPCGRAACGVAYLQSNGTTTSNKLYIFGGRTFGSYLDDVWSWEEDTNRWELVEVRKDQPSPAKRWAHSMVSYPGGFLVYGGSAPGVLFDDLWSFQPELGWKKIECSGALPPSRAGQAALLHENCFYISGGNTAGPMVQTYQDFWRMSLHFPSGSEQQGHPKPIGSWKQIGLKGPKLTARIGHSIIPLNDSRILLFGGRNLSYGVKEKDQFATNADIIDVGTNTNTLVELPAWLQRTGACALNHPEGVVIWGGLASDRVRCTTASVAPAVLLRPL